jgi:hypothetical protein
MEVLGDRLTMAAEAAVGLVDRTELVQLEVHQRQEIPQKLAVVVVERAVEESEQRLLHLQRGREELISSLEEAVLLEQSESLVALVQLVAAVAVAMVVEMG